MAVGRDSCLCWIKPYALRHRSALPPAVRGRMRSCSRPVNRAPAGLLSRTLLGRSVFELYSIRRTLTINSRLQE